MAEDHRSTDVTIGAGAGRWGWRRTVAILAVLGVAWAAIGEAGAVPDPGPPAAPTAVSAEAGSGRATVSWTAPDDTGGTPIVQYAVAAVPQAGATSPTVRTQVGTAATSLTVTGLTQGVTYTFMVAARNEDFAAFGPYSALSDPVLLPRKPEAPTITSATVAGPRQVALEWAAPTSDAAITSYTVLGSATRPDGSPVSANAQVKPAAPEDPVPTQATVTVPVSGLTYRFTVLATSVAGQGPASGLSDPVLVPDVPQPPVITSITAPTATSLALAWDEPASDAPITRYTIVASGFRSDGTEHRVSRLVTGTPPATSFTITGLLSTVTYAVTVSATSAAGIGAPSVPRSLGSPELPAPRSATVPTFAYDAADVHGNSHGCLVMGDGKVRCFGANGSGQLGNGTTGGSSPLVATEATGVADAVSVAVGDEHSCALHVDGTVSCWGSNTYGQLGNGTTTASATPVPVSGIADATTIAAGGLTTCALRAGGTVSCWGSDGYGALGNGTPDAHSSLPVSVSGVSGAVAIGVGGSFGCAVLSDGTGRCWGNNASGQLGTGTTTSSSDPVTVVGLDGAASLSLGQRAACAVRSNGSVACWGGKDGIGTTAAVVSGLVGVVRASVGYGQTCVLLSDGTARCWGTNRYRELATSDTPGTVVAPTSFGGMTGLTDLGAGSLDTCVVRAPGTLHCAGTHYGDWGATGPRQVSGVGLPTDIAPNITVPHPVARATSPAGAAVYFDATVTATDLVDGTVPVTCDRVSGSTFALGRTTVTCTAQDSAGNTARASFVVAVIDPARKRVDLGTNHSCAVTDAGGVRCWGEGVWGKLGNGTSTDSSVPVAVSGLTDAVAVSAGDEHTCAVTASGTVWCWGFNSSGQLGNGTTTRSSVPVQVSGLTTAVAVSAGTRHSCAVLSDGTAWCWGNGGNGRLGTGSNTSSTVPVQVTGVNDAVAVSAATTTTCAVRASGPLTCWPGSGAATYGQIPEAVVDVASGGVPDGTATTNTQSCAVLTTGRVRCWGLTLYGSLGNGVSGVGTSTPGAPEVIGLRDAISISGNQAHVCVTTASGAVRCWGWNSSAQLGDGTTFDRSLFVTPTGLPPSGEVSAGGNHTCARLDTGALRCWGGDAYGQLGNGRTATRFPTPVAVTGWP
jgi:alpha-tubulin suppressor-like RCC1 family protein